MFDCRTVEHRTVAPALLKYTMVDPAGLCLTVECCSIFAPVLLQYTMVDRACLCLTVALSHHHTFAPALLQYTMVDPAGLCLTVALSDIALSFLNNVALLQINISVTVY